MDASTSKPGIWRFGGAELDERTAELTVEGVRAALDRSSYDVLLALLRHSGEVVTKEELLEAGWPGRVVSENSLAKAVSRLRHALGDHAEALRAVHGYGYRLAAAVTFQPGDGDAPTPAAHDATHLHVGDAVPHRPGWRLQRRLGEGGAGMAFLAAGPDGATRVVKIATHEQGLQGLKREIALARYIGLLHAELPDVAPILGWNLTQPPFFLEMPHFPNGDLAAWAAQPEGLATLSAPDRIALCARLCDAVAGLHEIGIIHKDLKPENLYPQRDADGQWHLMLADLGAGEAAPSPRLAELGVTLSMAAQASSDRAGSLLYLAPEVIAGSMPTQRSDVFALGVLTYQLLVGDLRRPLAPGWDADIDDELLRDDIAMAAATHPERRLLSARELATRLRGLEQRRARLAGQRAAAQQHAQTRRALERNRARRPWRMATAAVLLIGTATSSWLYVKALAASREARESAAIADAVNRFFNLDVLSAASPYRQGARHELTVREAIDQAVTRIDSRLAQQPVVEATVRMAIGQVYGEMMQIGKAIEQEREAVALFDRHLGPADIRTQQARYRLAIDLTDDSRFGEARALVDGADALRRELDLDDAETTLLSHRARCYWHIRRERYDAGQAACEGVIAQQLRVDANDHNALIKARANLAVLHSRAGRAPLAEEQFTRIEESLAALGDRASPTWVRFRYLHGMNLLALDRLDAAETALNEAYRGSVAALGIDNPHTLEVQMGLAQLDMRRRRPMAAIPRLQQALSAYTRQLGADSHFAAEARQSLAAAQCAAATGAAGANAGEPAC